MWAKVMSDRWLGLIIAGVVVGIVAIVAVLVWVSGAVCIPCLFD